jgi:hypothetical protein
MHEDRPEMETPPRVRALLSLYGGRTPDGRPLWRLILAQFKRLRVEGVMRTMPKTVTERWQNGALRTDIPSPDKVEEGVFWVPRYKFTGWILERWFPGDAWGSEDLYSSQRSGADGRSRMMAGWPRNGDYFMLNGPWPTIDAAGDLKQHIREYMLDEREKPTDWSAHLRGELASEVWERDRVAAEYEDHLSTVARSEVDPILGSISHAAQQVRDQVAREVGGGEDFQLGAF